MANVADGIDKRNANQRVGKIRDPLKKSNKKIEKKKNPAFRRLKPPTPKGKDPNFSRQKEILSQLKKKGKKRKELSLA